MNEQELHDTLNEAAADFAPMPNVGRLTSLLHQPRRGRPVAYGVTAAAAALLFTVGGVAAISGNPTVERITPADGTTLPEPTELRRSDTATTTTETHTDHTADSHPDLSDRDGIEFSPLTPAPTTDAVGDHSVPATTVTEPDDEPAASPAVETTPPTTHTPADTAPLITQAPVTTSPTTQAPVTTAPLATSPPTTHAPETTSPPTTHAPETTSPPTTTGATVGFTANQVWGSCSLVPPYEELNGTAQPGSTVSVTSPFGSASTTADAGGHWYVQVFFSDAPAHQSFTITVSSAQGSANFPFVFTP